MKELNVAASVENIEAVTDFVNGELRFHYCGTEIVYKKSGVKKQESGLTLSKEDSAHLFARDGVIKQLIIEV